jgi:nitrite reductase/ring-hydroxylating ferredoxin subunit
MTTHQQPESIQQHQTSHPDGCDDCPVSQNRRAFLRDAALASVGALVAVTFAPSLAHAVRSVQPLGNAGETRYELPAVDGVSIDDANEVILVRWERRIYAFSSRCTHRGARLQWREDEGRVYCPKHKARFRRDGAHDSGRRTRDLDRHPIQRRGESLVIDLDVVLRADTDFSAWSAAVVQLD